MKPPVYTIESELSADIVEREITVLRGMPKLTAQDLKVGPANFTPPEIQEVVRRNSKNILLHQQWLDLLRRVVPSDVDDKIRLLRDLHLQKLAENLIIIETLQSASPVN